MIVYFRAGSLESVVGGWYPDSHSEAQVILSYVCVPAMEQLGTTPVWTFYIYALVET